MGETQEKEVVRTPAGPDGFRTVSKYLCVAISLIGCFFTADLNVYLGLDVMREQYYGIMIALVLACTFLLLLDHLRSYCLDTIKASLEVNIYYKIPLLLTMLQKGLAFCFG